MTHDLVKSNLLQRTCILAHREVFGKMSTNGRVQKCNVIRNGNAHTTATDSGRIHCKHGNQRVFWLSAERFLVICWQTKNDCRFQDRFTK